MSVKDMIKKSVLESDMYSQVISTSTILTIMVDLVVALIMGLLIYYVYKKYFQGVVYSRSFAMTLVGMCVLTCMVTLAISTNVVISLGMVGALSIVRYRTAVKEPSDLLYLFWSITTGITIGASMYILAISAAIVMICLIALFHARVLSLRSYILIMHTTGDCDTEIESCIKDLRHSLKSKILRKEETEITVQMTCKETELGFAEKLRSLDKVKDVTLVEYTGEYHG